MGCKDIKEGVKGNPKEAIAALKHLGFNEAKNDSESWRHSFKDFENRSRPPLCRTHISRLYLEKHPLGSLLDNRFARIALALISTGQTYIIPTGIGMMFPEAVILFGTYH
jgi:hypothetical protein